MAVIPTLLCPSNPQPAITERDQTPDYQKGNGGIGGIRGARTDYTGNLGYMWLGWTDCQSNWNQGMGNGSAWNDQWKPFENRYDNPNPVPRAGVFWVTGACQISDIVDGTSNTVAVFENHHWLRGPGHAQHNKAETKHRAMWMSSMAAVDSLDKPINLGRINDDNDCRCAGWSSSHPGGAHAVLSDATVKFYSQDMDQAMQTCDWWCRRWRDSAEGLGRSLCLGWSIVPNHSRSAEIPISAERVFLCVSASVRTCRL